MYDHRKLGRELGLFDSDPLIGAGLPYWLPAGAAVRHALENYIAEVERRAGYQQVYSPVLGKRELYEISGHWAKYHEDMYPPMDMGGEQLVLRPSICPHHALMFRSRSHSYRELPLRYSELGGQYRAELSGAIGGLSRVRAMQLNDAHIFCRLDQVAGEASGALRLIKQAYADMGISASRYVLALPSDDAEFNSPASKYVGDAASWAQAVELLREVLKDAGVDYFDAPGDAAFYGPKIDIQLEDSAGREFSLSTVQIDFHQPERFGLEYIGADGNKHRPVMVHRAIVGSIERAVAQLIEVHGGAFPAWLAPVQVVVLPISDDEEKLAAEVARRASDRGLRVEIAHADEGSLGARIRENRLVPYQAVIGSREADGRELAVRERDGRRWDAAPIGEVLDRIRAAADPQAIAIADSGEL
ncbi:threonyl-tRNA synthetase [Kribbella sp. VKM Ac-2571]|uniref:threonine--tRNA ligase n=1 Tax=Kribbella sp. VKM Ac-2571 TaxID=2512222 RepID=UPI001060B7E3|nr:threonine--tRNA ligase [Kribbella sp. VKM Ac-2571]TDO55562.1 threonyl-tRNA synthetase [Kribbella sp. VKM Ac-2571]